MDDNRGIRVILFSDVVDSSGRMFSDEANTILLIEHDLEKFKEGVDQLGGRLIKTTGDGILATFATSNQALEFIQKFLVELNQKSSQTLQHRFGLHIGEIYIKNGDIIGQGVHLAARLQTISPINGVAFTQGTYSIIAPLYRDVAVPLGSIQLKGLPEELICYAIEESSFLGCGGNLKTANIADKSPPPSTGSDSDYIRCFIDSHHDLITKEPSRAIAILGDWVQERNHLLVGARDILARPEWAQMLNNSGPELLSTQVIRTRLTDWIKSTFAEATALPWIEAISDTEPDHHADTSNQNKEADSAEDTSKDYARNFPWWISIITAILVAAAVAGITQLRKGQPPKAAPTSNDSQLTESRQLDLDDALIQGNGEDLTPSQSLLPETVRSNLGLDASPMPLPSRDGAADESPPTPTDTQSSDLSDLWDRLDSEIENGNINTTDLHIDRAQGYLDHWVQDFKRQGNSLVIRLRTREAVNSEICATLLAIYQKAYQQGSNTKPWIILESSRLIEGNNPSGYLPVCKLSPSGKLESLPQNQ